MEELRFDGRVAIVTGAGSGIGRAHALLLGQRGATVVVNDIGLRKSGQNSSPAEETVAAIQATGGEATANVGDVTSDADMEELVATTIDRYGRLDIVVTNAGIDGAENYVDLTREKLERYLQVHIIGSHLVTQKAWPHMVDQGYGRILMTGSAGFLGLERRAHYAAAKGGVLGLMRCLAVEGQPYGIGVNALWPIGRTPMMLEAFADAALPEEHQALHEALADVDLLAPVVAWLVHQDCNATGEILNAACGRVARVFLAQGPGIADRALTIESVRDRWSEICAESPLTVLNSMLDASRWAFS